MLYPLCLCIGESEAKYLNQLHASYDALTFIDIRGLFCGQFFLHLTYFFFNKDNAWRGCCISKCVVSTDLTKYVKLNQNIGMKWG